MSVELIKSLMPGDAMPWIEKLP